MRQNKYGYHGELEKIYIGGDEVADDGDHTNFNANISESVYNNPEEKKKFEEAHQSQKYAEMEEKPDQSTIENSDSYIKAQEEELLKNIQKDGSIAGDLNANGSLGKGSKVKGVGLFYAQIFSLAMLFMMN